MLGGAYKRILKRVFGIGGRWTLGISDSEFRTDLRQPEFQTGDPAGRVLHRSDQHQLRIKHIDSENIEVHVLHDLIWSDDMMQVL